MVKNSATVKALIFYLYYTLYLLCYTKTELAPPETALHQKLDVAEKKAHIYFV